MIERTHGRDTTTEVCDAVWISFLCVDGLWTRVLLSERERGGWPRGQPRDRVSCAHVKVRRKCLINLRWTVDTTSHRRHTHTCIHSTPRLSLADSHRLERAPPHRHRHPGRTTAHPRAEAPDRRSQDRRGTRRSRLALARRPAGATVPSAAGALTPFHGADILRCFLIELGARTGLSGMASSDCGLSDATAPPPPLTVSRTGP